MIPISIFHFSFKGWAIVTMIDANAAQAAIRDLNGVSIDGGKPIKVSARKLRYFPRKRVKLDD